MNGHRTTGLRERADAESGGFTVLELLIVIGVLSVLFSILLPVFSKAREATLRSRAQVEASSLAQAVVQYKNVYGYWPGMVTESGGALKIEQAPNRPAGAIDWPLVSNFSNEWFKVSVRSLDGSVNGEASYVTDNTLYRSLLPSDRRNSADKNRNPLNPQGLRFIDLKGEDDPQHVSLPDPWGNQYIVVMGLNPSTVFTHDFKNQDGEVLHRLSISNLTAFALSYGSDKRTLIFSAGITNGIFRGGSR